MTADRKPDLFSRRRFLGTTLLGHVTLGSGNLPTCHAASRWADQRSAGRFICHAEFPLAPYAPIFSELAGLEQLLANTLGIQPGTQPIEMYLFRDKSAYRNFLGRHFPELPYRRALFVKDDGPGQVFAYRHNDLPIDLRHEGTHALLHSSLAMVPLWLDEGLAEYFEVPLGRRANGHPHMPAVRWHMRLGTVVSLATLEQKRDLSEMGQLEYRFAWAWVHFMLHGPRASHRELVGFLNDIHRSRPPGRLSRRLSGALPEVDRQMVAHFKRWEPSAAG